MNTTRNQRLFFLLLSVFVTVFTFSTILKPASQLAAPTPATTPAPVTQSPSVVPTPDYCHSYGLVVCPDGNWSQATGPGCEYSPCAPAKPGQTHIKIHSDTLNLSFNSPLTWRVNRFEESDATPTHPYDNHLVLEPEDYQGIPLNFVNILFPISLTEHQAYYGFLAELPNREFATLYRTTKKPDEKYFEAQQFSIDGHEAISVKSVSWDTSDEYTFEGGEYCYGCVSKHVFIKLNNGEVLAIESFWDDTYPDFETKYDSIVNSLDFDRP